MIINKLKLINFRNYQSREFQFTKKLNFISGQNGTGKTSILEAIHYLAFSKSFRTNSDADVVNLDQQFFQIYGDFSTLQEKNLNINLNYMKNEGKKIFINKTELEKKTDIVGKVPVITLSPNNQRITEEGPALRRNFINKILSQSDNNYFKNLLEYKKRLTDRNTLLNDYREKGIFSYDTYIESSDELLAKAGVKIQEERIKFFIKFEPVFKKEIKKIAHFDNDVFLKIYFNIKTDENDIYETFLKSLKRKFQKDVLYGRTSCGPHLDDIKIFFDNEDIRKVGSQGEHKVTLIALKMAEGKFLKKKTKKALVYLLDDLFSLLDAEHCIKILKEISTNNQTFVTSADMEILKHYGLEKINSNVQIINLTLGNS